MVERLETALEGSRNKIEKKGGIQKWEYYTASVRLDKDYQISTGEKGRFGSDKTKKVPTWVGDLPGGNELPLRKFLQEMGENGWEIAGVAQTSIPVGEIGGPHWHDLSHFLYFKRPRMDNQSEK